MERVACGDEMVVTLVGFFNWPALIGLILPIGFMAAAQVPELMVAIVAAMSAWVSWYVLIRWMETRVENTVPLTLNLT